MNYQLKEKIENLLKQDERFYLAAKDHFFKNKITECANNLDQKLINLLLKDKDCKNKFFKTFKINDLESVGGGGGYTLLPFLIKKILSIGLIIMSFYLIVIPSLNRI